MNNSPFIEFDRTSWSKYRKGTPLTLTQEELLELQSYENPISQSEIEDVYLPLSRLLHMYVDAKQELYKVTSNFLGHPEPNVPFVIGISGSVAVGKSTTSRVLQSLLSHWPSHPQVVIVSTDNFLYSTAELVERGLMEKKGFPESYNLKALLNFMQDVKSGKPALNVPVYSHEIYDIVPGKHVEVDQPDIIIVEGLNVLQVGATSEGKVPRIYISDYFDFSIHVDADIELVKKWFIARFLKFRIKAKTDPSLFMHQFSDIPEDQAIGMAEYFWHHINEVNYFENIEPFKNRATCILNKAEDHLIDKIFLRK